MGSKHIIPLSVLHFLTVHAIVRVQSSMIMTMTAVYRFL